MAAICGSGLSPSLAQTPASAPAPPTTALPITVLMQSPAETKTDLQIFCLFRSSPENALHGSLLETNAKLHGLLDSIRKPGLFGGEVGETILLTPPDGTLGAKRVLIIGLGDSATFTPERMYLVGKVAIREANRLGVTHPFFAPTVLDGGVTRYAPGLVATQVVRGMLDAMATEDVLRAADASGSSSVQDARYLAGPKFAKDTQEAIDRVLGKSPSPVN
jgi:cytosol aminopeptidase family protein